MEDSMRMAGATQDFKVPDGQRQNVVRIGAQNDAMVSQLHGGCVESNARGMLFGGANQAAVTTTIALATTYTGLCLCNPIGNSKKFSLRQVGIALSVAPAGAGLIGLGGGWSTAGIATHTTPLIPYPMSMGRVTASTAQIDGASTLVAGAGAGLLRVIMPLMSAFTNATLPSTSPALINIDGAVEVLPGGFVFIYTLTVVIGFFGFVWEELPLA